MTRSSLLALALSLGLSAPAGALSPTPLQRPSATLVQFWGPPAFGPPTYFEDDEDELIPPGVAARNARAAGYRPIAPPRLVGQNWVIEAVNFDGLRVRVIVDGYSGRVIGARFVSAPAQPRFDDDLRPRRESRVDPRPDDSRLAELGEPRAEPRPARPPREQRTARLMPVPTPRPAIDAPAGIPPTPQTESAPARQSPATNVSPSGLSVRPIVPASPAPPPITVLPPPHAAPTPIQPAEPPTAGLPSRPEPSAPAPEVMPPPIEPAPVTLPLPGARPVQAPAPTIAEAPPPAEPALVETSTPGADEPTLIDGRRLAPNGEPLQGPAPAAPRVVR